MKTTLEPKTTLSRTALLLLRTELERARSRFGEIDPRSQVFSDALARLDDGTFGTCLSCEKPIPLERLSVVPETRYCVTCGARK